MRELGPKQVEALMQATDPPVLLDVREPWELETAAIAGAVPMPMGEVPARLGELDPKRAVVVVCHTGRRSAQVAYLLERSGFQEVINLTGGIEAWSQEVDPSVPTY